MKLGAEIIKIQTSVPLDNYYSYATDVHVYIYSAIMPLILQIYNQSIIIVTPKHGASVYRPMRHNIIQLKISQDMYYQGVWLQIYYYCNSCGSFHAIVFSVIRTDLLLVAP